MPAVLQSDAPRTPAEDPAFTRLWADLPHEHAQRFGCLLMEMNAGLNPAHPDWVTPSQLAAALLAAALQADLRRAQARAPTN